MKKISLPLTDETIAGLHSGDQVLLSGTLYTARDAAHKKLIDALDRGEKLPMEVKGQTIYYVGPTPASPGRVIGAAGPTTATRMDPYTPRLLDLGLKGIVAKGARSKEVKDSLQKNRAVYFASIGGAGALLSRAIKKAETIAFPELGPEAIMRLEVQDFPAIVVNDIYGGDLYQEGRARYQKTA